MQRLPLQAIAMIIQPLIDQALCMVSGNRRHKDWEKSSQLWAKSNPCEFTGKTHLDARLTVHHIIPFHVRPDLEMDEANWFSVTDPWHLVICHVGNFSNWMVEVELRRVAEMIRSRRSIFERVGCKS